MDTKLQQMKQKDAKNLFKLKKFQNVAPRTNTYSRKGFSERSVQPANEENPENHEIKPAVYVEENQQKPSAE